MENKEFTGFTIHEDIINFKNGLHHNSDQTIRLENKLNFLLGNLKEIKKDLLILEKRLQDYKNI